MDVVHLDALHSYEAVSQDLRNVLTSIPCCVKEIIFHDWHYHDAVQAAVYENRLPLLQYIGESDFYGSGEREGVVTSALPHVPNGNFYNFHAMYLLVQDVLRVHRTYFLYDADSDNL